MTMALPQPVAVYFAAKNSHDTDAMLTPFLPSAIVRDEGNEHLGHAAIRTWLEETTKKYRVVVALQDVAERDGVTEVVGLVSGSFPGSPARLLYKFEHTADGISRLEIG